MHNAGRAGVARVDITPDVPLPLAGFGQRTTPSSGVLDRIAAKALYLECADQRLLIVTADLLCIPRRLGAAVVAALARHTALTPPQICVCASHTHSAPAIDGDYAAFVVREMVRAGTDAVATARPATLVGGVGRTDLLLNRRTRGAPNHVDERVPVIAALADGAPFALLFGVGCHPVTLGWDNPSISGDFPGWAQRALERDLPGATALFFNTTEGNVVPLTSPNRDALDPRGYCGGTLADTERVGAAIAAEVRRVLARAEPLDWRLAAARADLQLPPAGGDLAPEVLSARLDASRDVLTDFLGRGFEASTAPTRLWAAASAVVMRRDLPEPEMRRLMVACCDYLGARARLDAGSAGPRTVTAPVQVLGIGDFEFAALPGEVLVEVGDAWTQRTGSPRAFVIGLANAHLRYLPHPRHFAEPESAVRYETVTAGLDADGVAALLDAATRLHSPHSNVA